MSDERKPVLCPWCGEQMRLWEDGNMAWFECMDCGAQTPTAFSDADDAPTDVMREAAYIAATRRPENRALTLEGMAEMDESDAVWVVAKDGTVCVVNGMDAHEYAGYEYDALYFASKPTPEDIEAARKELNG